VNCAPRAPQAFAFQETLPQAVGPLTQSVMGYAAGAARASHLNPMGMMKRTKEHISKKHTFPRSALTCPAQLSSHVLHSANAYCG